MSRVYNFSAGPAVLPEEVLKEAAAEMLDYKGTGMSVMEMSHRSKAFEEIITEAEQDLRDLMNIPDNYKVLFLQGGASQQFAMIPMNLMKNKIADYIVTGQWAKKAAKEAEKYGKVNVVASSADKTFSYIPDCSDLPIVLYNVPSRTGVSFTADTLYELSKHPNINGLKAASGNFSLLAETMAKCGDNLNVWSGNDDQIVPLMSLGGKGVISVLSNVAPQVAHDITQLCFDNRYPEAAKLQLQYHDLIDALFCEVNPIPVKKAMELLGWKVGGLRLPLVEPSEEHIAYIKRELENAGCKI